MKKCGKASESKNSTASIGFEAKLWLAAELVDSMVALPGQVFYGTQIPVCLWFLAKSKAADAKRGFRNRRKQTLFIDARKLGTLIDRVHRELMDADLEIPANRMLSIVRIRRCDSGKVSGNDLFHDPRGAFIGDDLLLATVDVHSFSMFQSKLM